MKTFIVDDQSPEVVAMLQALYSRSPKSVVEHLEQVRERGADKFMSTYYVGYGHKSIGDCGTTSIFVENVSMLAAKAIQDNPLYNGQEASTRYLDMATQEVLNPLGTVNGHAVQDGWMRLYSKALTKLVPILKERFPRQEGEKETIWEKAIKAKAFDIARGLLPAGATTFVAWHTNLRQAYEHTRNMRYHPLPEVSNIGSKLLTDLQGKYPASFGHKVSDAETVYYVKSMDRFAYHDEPLRVIYESSNNIDTWAFDKAELDLLATRPPRTELHQRFRQCGNFEFKFALDFGSYRDLQRQRSAIQEMPLLTTKNGFNFWYTQNLPQDMLAEIEEQKQAVDALMIDAELPVADVIKQYYVAMGYNCNVKITCPLPAAVYIAELRSATTVHPTLRMVAQWMGESIKQAIPGIAMHHDMSPDSWNIKRGTQDIVKK